MGFKNWDEYNEHIELTKFIGWKYKQKHRVASVE